ncbi:MAG TPA: iron export ABC transporter permease subunit FetB [Massilibacterium sp.]|nr:iron export ABC transporter permease subunit FetB [Massilibacterium sp.]
MNEIVEIPIWRLVLAYIFIVFLYIVVKIKGINREKEILMGTIRMSIQLLLVGYLLMYLFENPHPLWTLLVIFIMEGFAIHNIYKRSSYPLLKKTKQVIAFSMIAGTMLSIFYFNLVVVHFSPWYDPRYFIPIGGMIIGNSMTGIALGVNTLVEGMQSKRPMIEGTLMLGATPKQATKRLVNQAFDSAILPTINSMIGMGIVFLPGMMTGQILSGVDPLVSIEYQIAIMLGISGSVALTVLLFTTFGYRTFFNERNQLIEVEEKEV